MSEERENIFDLRDELEELKGAEIIQETESIRNSLRILDINYQVLIQSEETLEEQGIHLFDQQNREKWMNSRLSIYVVYTIMFQQYIR